jgi:hypothetical protein
MFHENISITARKKGGALRKTAGRPLSGLYQMDLHAMGLNSRNTPSIAMTSDSSADRHRVFEFPEYAVPWDKRDAGDLFWIKAHAECQYLVVIEYRN